MEWLILLILVTVGGSSGFIFQSNNCDLGMPKEFRETMLNFPPNEQELKTLCPGSLELMECYDNEHQNITGETFQDLTTSSDERKAQMGNFFYNLLDLIKDVCNEKTQFHKDYVENSQCYKEILLAEIRKCQTEAHRLYTVYKMSSSNGSEEVPTEAHCLTKAYELACGLKGVEESCGETAGDVFLEVLRRLRGLEVAQCDETNKATLRGKFLDFLEDQGKERDHYSTAFGL